MAPPGHEVARVRLDVPHGAETVVLQLKQPVRVVEWLRHAHERHGSVEHRLSASRASPSAKFALTRFVEGGHSKRARRSCGNTSRHP
jgi:hypothetical protein